MFIPVPSHNKMLVAPEVFKKVNHRLFDWKHKVDYKGKPWIVLRFDDVIHAIFARHQVPAPAPIEHYYTWPGRYRPFKHQIETAKFFTAYERCFCFNSMGSGKTNAALWAADYLISRGVHHKVLVVSPVSTLERVWGDALFESFHHRSYRVIYGTRQKRLKLLQEDADFYVINHDGLKIPEILEQLRKMDITLVIADEFRTYHNQKTQRYKALQTLAGPETQKSLWAMTGAPMPNGPEDIWAQARLINPNLVPKYFNRFRHETMIQLTQFKWVPKKGWEDKCYSMVKPSIRYSTEDCLDLPDISYVAHEVAMSSEQAKMYDQVYKTCVAEAKEGKIVAANEAVKLMKLLQIATGAVYTSEKSNVADLAPTPKLAALEELVYETNRKCIIFTPFVHSIEMLEKFLKKKGFKVAAIHGGTGIAKRNSAFSEFQQGDLEIILAHPQCMAHGVTLTAACHIIWFAPIDNFEIYEQANARVRRAGQTRAQTIIHLQCSKVEQHVYNRLKAKEKTQGVLLELLKSK